MKDDTLDISLVLKNTNPDILIGWLTLYVARTENHYVLRQGVWVTYSLDSNTDEWSHPGPSGLPNWLYELCVHIGSCASAVIPGSIPFEVQPLYRYSPEEPSGKGQIRTTVTDRLIRPNLRWLLHELLGAIAVWWPEVRKQVMKQGIDVRDIPADTKEMARQLKPPAVSDCHPPEVPSYAPGVGVAPNVWYPAPWQLKDLDAGLNRNLRDISDRDDRLSFTREPISSTSVMYTLRYLESDYQGAEDFGRLEICEWYDESAATRFAEPPKPPLWQFADEAEREKVHRRRVQHQRTLWWELTNRLQADPILIRTWGGYSLPRPARRIEAKPQTSTEDAASDILPDELHPGGKYGTNRDLTFEDVKAIVTRCRAFQERGGKVPDFYDQLNLDPFGPRYFELETLRGWLKDPKFAPEDTQ